MDFEEAYKKFLYYVHHTLEGNSIVKNSRIGKNKRNIHNVNIGELENFLNDNPGDEDVDEEAFEAINLLLNNEEYNNEFKDKLEKIDLNLLERWVIILKYNMNELETHDDTIELDNNNLDDVIENIQAIIEFIESIHLQQGGRRKKGKKSKKAKKTRKSKKSKKSKKTRKH